MMTAPSPLTQQPARYLCAVLLVSKDPARLMRFYRDVLGIPLGAEEHDDTAVHYGCNLGEVHFAIHPLENFGDANAQPGAVRFALEVFDLPGTLDAMRSKGVSPLFPPRSLGGTSLLTAVQDPDGNVVELTQLSPEWFESLHRAQERGDGMLAHWQQRHADHRQA